MNKVTVVTVPGIIEPSDWEKLNDVAEVEYIERDNVTPEELLNLIKETNYLMLNYDIVQNIPESFL